MGMIEAKITIYSLKVPFKMNKHLNPIFKINMATNNEEKPTFLDINKKLKIKIHNNNKKNNMIVKIPFIKVSKVIPIQSVKTEC